MLHRFGHTALCAHWTVLAAIWIAGDRVHGRRWRLGAWLALCAAVAAIQPYLAAMVVPMALAGVVSDGWAEARTTRSALIAGAGAAAFVAITFVVFWVSGYFLLGSATDFGLEGVGYFSMNLLSPVIGNGYSGLLPEIPTATPGQYEGLVYFGVGWLALAAAALAIGARRGFVLPPLRLGWIVVGGLLLLAISPVVTLGGSVLVDLRRWAPSLLAVFRSSGRFAWLAMYVVFAATLATLVSRLPRRTAVAILTAGLVLQVLDLGGAYGRARARSQDPAWTDWDTPLKSAVWTTALPHYRHLVMAPPDMCAAVWAEPAGPHLPFSLVAGGHGLTINSGNAGRYDAGGVLAYCAALEAELAAGRVSDDSLYVLNPRMRQVLGGVHADAARLRGGRWIRGLCHRTQLPPLAGSGGRRGFHRRGRRRGRRSAAGEGSGDGWRQRDLLLTAGRGRRGGRQRRGPLGHRFDLGARVGHREVAALGPQVEQVAIVRIVGVARLAGRVQADAVVPVLARRR